MTQGEIRVIVTVTPHVTSQARKGNDLLQRQYIRLDLGDLQLTSYNGLHPAAT